MSELRINPARGTTTRRLRARERRPRRRRARQARFTDPTTMRNNDQPSGQTLSSFHLHLGDTLGGMTFETLAERGRPAHRLIADRTCDGCGDPDPTVDLWAEHPETGEQLRLCAACGE